MATTTCVKVAESPCRRVDWCHCGITASVETTAAENVPPIAAIRPPSPADGLRAGQRNCRCNSDGLPTRSASRTAGFRPVGELPVKPFLIVFLVAAAPLAAAEPEKSAVKISFVTFG